MNRSDVKMLLFINPHSPTGRVWTQEELEKVVGIMERTGKILLSDEIYSSLAHKQFYSMLRYANRLGERLIVTNSPSKAFNVSGSSCGYGIFPNIKLVQQYKELEVYKYTCFPTFFSLVILKACYRHGKAWLKETNEYIRENIQLLQRTFSERFHNVQVYIPDAGYAALIDLTHYGLSGSELDAIFKKHNIIMSSMKCYFWPHTETLLFRMTLACNRDYLKRFFDRLETALQGVLGIQKLNQ
jgi:cystathionine beta-lyase